METLLFYAPYFFAYAITLLITLAAKDIFIRIIIHYWNRYRAKKRLARWKTGRSGYTGYASNIIHEGEYTITKK